jgi:hypothetical protein
MDRTQSRILALFLTQIILALCGTRIFQKEANPFALLLVSTLLVVACFQVLKRPHSTEDARPKTNYAPWLHAFAAMFGLFTAYEELRKIWAKYPEPGKISDVLPQLETMCSRFFAGEFPYQIVKLPTHEPYPVYMPLHWGPIQISHALGIDVRWSGMVMLLAAVGIAAYWLSKSVPDAPLRRSLPAMLLFALPVWGFVFWAKIDIAVSLEGVVAAWYILLAAGLATRHHALIAIGLVGALLSRYTLLFWVPFFATLLWLNAPRKYSYWIWGSALAAGLAIFVVPFWAKDPSIVSKILAYYSGCSEGSWLRPDEYTFMDGLSLNIHLRQWLPGAPADNLPFAHYPQIGLQLLLGTLGVYFYQRKWRHTLDVYTFALLLLALMIPAFYIFSPMLFKYYMLMPLSVSAVLVIKGSLLPVNSY